MPHKNLLGYWIRRFLLEHIVDERNLARNTQVSYRDALALLIPFVTYKSGKPIDQLTVEHVTPEIVRKFLAHIEQERGCRISTRNQRLAAIHALARFIASHSPEYIAWYTALQTIPAKKGTKDSMPYLDKPEMDALLAAPDRRTAQGVRDHALLLFLYNCGTRADEAARLTIADLDLRGSPAAVKVFGKGRKIRLCPLWSLTVDTLSPLIAGRDPGEKVFLNRRKQSITRFGIYALIRRYILKVGKQIPSLLTKRVGPHTIRHTSAVHLLRAGVDIDTIRDWLGHVSVDTTNVYAQVDLQMKAKALAQCEITGKPTNHRGWHRVGLLAFLKAL